MFAGIMPTTGFDPPYTTYLTNAVGVADGNPVFMDSQSVRYPVPRTGTIVRFSAFVLDPDLSLDPGQSVDLELRLDDVVIGTATITYTDATAPAVNQHVTLSQAVTDAQTLSVTVSTTTGLASPLLIQAAVSIQ